MKNSYEGLQLIAAFIAKENYAHREENENIIRSRTSAYLFQDVYEPVNVHAT